MQRAIFISLLSLGFGGSTHCAERAAQNAHSASWSAMSHRNRMGRTAIHNAVAAGHVKTLKRYLKTLQANEIADILFIQDQDEKTPLHLALARACAKSSERDTLKAIWHAVPAGKRFEVLLKREKNQENFFQYLISHEEEHDFWPIKQCMFDDLEVTQANLAAFLEQADNCAKGALRRAVDVNN